MTSPIIVGINTAPKIMLALSCGIPNLMTSSFAKNVPILMPNIDLIVSPIILNMKTLFLRSLKLSIKKPLKVYCTLESDAGKSPCFIARSRFSLPPGNCFGKNKSKSPESIKKPNITTKPSHQAPTHSLSLTVS